MEINQLKNNLSDFINTIKRLSFVNEEIKADVYQDYQELYEVYKSLNDNEINSNFTQEEIKIINFLELGLAQQQNFNQLLNQIHTNSKITLLNVVDFIKSRNGFNLMHKKDDFSNYTEEELINIFGGIFGVELSRDCVKQLKAEKVSRVIGYALSELFDEHLLEYKEILKINSKENLGNFIKSKIEQSDFECSYVFNEKVESSIRKIEVSANINQRKNASSLGLKNRSKNRIDNCFINKKTKTITFGQGTSNDDTKEQNNSYYKSYVVLNELVNKKKIDGEDNPYYGYRLNPYYFFSGRFAIDNKKVTQEKGRDFKKLLKKASNTELEKLGQMQYYSLYANAVNKDSVNTLNKYNIFISGCDTLNLFSYSESLINKTNEEQSDMAFKHIVKYVTDVVSIFNKNEISFNQGTKGIMLLYFNDIFSITTNIFLAFNKNLNEDEYNEMIKPLVNQMNKLKEKTQNVLTSEMSQLQMNFASFDLMYSNIESYNKLVSAVPQIPIKYEWDDKKELNIDKDNLNNTIKIAKHIYENMGSQGKKFFNKYIKALDYKINNNQKLSDNFNANSFRQVMTNFINDEKKLTDYNYAETVKFIEKTKFILNERINDATIEKNKEELVEHIKEMIVYDNEIKNLVNKKIRKSKLKNN